MPLPARTRRSVKRFLSAVAALVAALATITLSPSPAAATPVSVLGERMQLVVPLTGANLNVGWVDHLLKLDYLNNRPNVSGSIRAVHAESGWSEAGYPNQTKVACTNDLWTGSTYYSQCYVRVRMQKPGQLVGLVSASYKGVQISLGYEPNSGQSYVDFIGVATITRPTVSSAYRICYSFGSCRNYEDPSLTWCKATDSSYNWHNWLNPPPGEIRSYPVYLGGGDVSVKQGQLTSPGWYGYSSDGVSTRGGYIIYLPKNLAACTERVTPPAR